MKIKFVVPILIVTLVSGIAVAYANSNSESLITLNQATQKSELDQTFKSAVKSSDFIFQGVVTKVEYRMSDASSKGTPQLPYTFVTYKIEKLVKGQNQQEFVTLRFLGGTDRNGNILQVSDVPLFDVGDRDILFVSRNGQSVCPLVECEKGRFRLINQQVFDNFGKPLLLNQEELVLGRRVQMQEVLVNRIGSHVVEYDVSDNQEKTELPTQNTKQQLNLPSLNEVQFEGLIQNQIQRLIQSRELQVQPIVSVDIQEPLSAPLVQPARPPQVPSDSQLSVGESERQEITTEIRQQPVIKQPQN
ncbi:hypothetical protein [Nostoc sp. FACHB-280]|uniref:hypothetical protein n=1 Tax=Nostoc sp. FACHB-280 TaxID=2692839 RepID=UPI00168A6C5C|nr:hypothetical protein [Nostoc sp. FACHB-280]MBD2497922.1 hypothetical protein [Nostoc sp. FACHB-280]